MNDRKRILVVDDDPVVGKSIDRVLSPKGYAVITTSSGEEALARIAAEDYDMVFTDIRMPGMDGIEVTRRIRASHPWMPVLIVTGFGTDAHESAATDLGVKAFLRKPLAPDTIAESAEEALAAADAAWAPITIPALEARRLEAPARRSRWIEARLFAKNALLFFAAPLVALLYVVIGPFIALGLLAKAGLEALLKR